LATRQQRAKSAVAEEKMVNEEIGTELRVVQPGGPSARDEHNPVSKRAAIAAKARKNPKEQFNNLLHHLTYELVEECLHELPLSSAISVSL
jgi:hypothetical protein